MKGLLRASGLVAITLLSSLFVSTSPVSAASFPGGFQQFFVTGGLTNPTSMALAPDGRIFVCLQGGQLRVIKNGALLPDEFVTVAVDPNGERGLLGVAFDPNFSSNHFVYVYYTVPGSPPHNRVSKFTANGDVASGPEIPLFDLDDLADFTNHNGGALAFGPDGKLYIAAGENAIPSNSQTLSNLLGKVLRINSDGSIPTDNPFFNVATGRNRAIWAMGLRNPFSIVFQPGTSRFFINDVGQSAFEEINLGVAGANYGWPSCEGPCTPTNPSFRDPIYYYGHGGGSHTGCALTTGVFYNPISSSFPPQYTGKYFFADLCSNWINVIDPLALPVPNGAATFATSVAGFPVSLLVTPNGFLYYLSRTGSGELWRVEFTGQSTPEGNVDSVTCESIAGWAWDPALPNSPINVDIIADGQVIAAVSANQFRQDLLDAEKGNGQHGFGFTVPASLKDGRTHSITVRISSTSILIAAPTLIICGGGGPGNGGPLSLGNLESVTCNTISGWAWDPTLPNSPINLDIMADGQVIATLPADQFRQDLLNAGKGNGLHAFSFQVPASLKNGQLHSISVRVTGTNVFINIAPRLLVCGGSGGPGNGGPLSLGNLESVTCNTISGWAWDPTLPNSPINLDIMADGLVIATLAADQFRQDLLNAGKGNGLHAFSFQVPVSLKNGQLHSISVRVTGTNVFINIAPRLLVCGGSGGPGNGGPLSLGNLESVTCNTISGWAWDPTLPNSPINLDIMADGQVIATLPADQFRQDLFNAGKGNGLHSFSFQVPASLKNGQLHSISVRVTGTTIFINPVPRLIVCASP